MSKKIFISLIIVLIVIVMVLGLWWWLYRRGVVPKPADLFNQPVKNGIIVNPETSSSSPELTLPVDQRTSQEVILANLIRNFVERVASYSETNLVAAKQAVMALPVNPAVVNQLVISLPKPWQAVESRALKVEPVKIETGKVSFTVTVQRQWQGATQEAVSYHTMTVVVQTTAGSNWQITQAEWQ